MSKSRKKSGCGCGCGSEEVAIVDPGSISRNRNFRRGTSLFPTDIKKLLTLIAEDEGDNRVDIVLDACSSECFIEDARVIAVTDNTVIIREGRGCDGKFRFVCIGCICEVIVDCDTILEELFEEHSFNRE